MKRRRVALSLLLALALIGCDDDPPGNTTDDTATVDTTEADAGDTAAIDSTENDTGEADTSDASGDTNAGDSAEDATSGDADDATSDADAPPEDVCEPIRTCSGGVCCADDEVCALNDVCCPLTELCGTQCCGSGEVCEGGVCKLDCGETQRCATDTGDLCCAAAEICTSGQCFEPTTSCVDFVDCEADQYCDSVLGQCLPQPGGEVCQETPSGGSIAPVELWSWDGTGAALSDWNQVMMAPMVALIDDDDIPDVAFNTFCGVQSSSQGCVFGRYTHDGILRVISGADGSPIIDITDPTLRVNPGAQIAIGDIDGDTRAELVTCASDSSGYGPIIAFNHDGTRLWITDDTRVLCGEAAPGIADFDGDGAPEVYLRYTIVNGATGEVLAHNDCKGTGGWADTDSTGSHSPCDYNVAVDLDEDGDLEIVGGNAAYHHDGSVYYDRSADFRDGYPAIGDLDLDGTPEVVVINSAFTPTPYQGDHFIRALNADGTDRWGPFDINQDNVPQAQIDADTVGGGGPATIANFDDDPEPEIALAGAYSYNVFEADGTIKWFKPTSDRSSRKTGSSVFDFDGDGVAEAVYADEYWLRVYDGRDGEVRFCECNPSATLWEYPLVVDVNSDGAAEIVVASNDYAGGGRTCASTTFTTENGLDDCVQARIDAGEIAGSNGIRALVSPDEPWVGTRKVWNQHTYHVTNISEAGVIPAQEKRNWDNAALNNFRQNVQPGASNLPDLVPTDLSADIRNCLTDGSIRISFRVVNQGWSAAEAGVPISVYVEVDGVETLVGTTTTSTRLLSGESEVRWVLFTNTDRLTAFNVRVAVGDPGDLDPVELTECVSDNNAATAEVVCFIN